MSYRRRSSLTNRPRKVSPYSHTYRLPPVQHQARQCTRINQRSNLLAARRGRQGALPQSTKGLPRRAFHQPANNVKSSSSSSCWSLTKVDGGGDVRARPRHGTPGAARDATKVEERHAQVGSGLPAMIHRHYHIRRAARTGEFETLVLPLTPGASRTRSAHGPLGSSAGRPSSPRRREGGPWLLGLDT